MRQRATKILRQVTLCWGMIFELGYRTIVVLALR